MEAEGLANLVADSSCEVGRGVAITPADPAHVGVTGGGQGHAAMRQLQQTISSFKHSSPPCSVLIYKPRGLHTR